VTAALALILAFAVTPASPPATTSAIHYARTIPIAAVGHGPIALSPDGKWLATNDGGRVRIFATSGMRQIASLKSPSGNALVAFSPNGATLAGAGNAVVAWSTADWTVRWSLPAQGFTALAWAPDGATLFLAGGTATLAAYDAAGHVRWTGASVATPTSRIAVSPDGKLAAAGSYGGGLRLLSTVDGTAVGSLADTAAYGGKTTAAQRAGWLAHPGTIEALVFTADGTKLASAGADGTIKLWDVARHRVLWTNICGTSTSSLVLENARTLDAACGWNIRRLALANGMQQPKLGGHGGDVDALALEPGGASLWSAAEDGTLKRWDLRRRSAVATYGAIGVAALTPDGRRLAFGRGDSDIVELDLGTDRPIATVSGNVLPETLGSYSYSAALLAISDDGRWLASGGYVTSGFIDHAGVAKAVMRVWRSDRAAPLFTWNGVAPDRIAFAPDARRIVVRSPEMTDTRNTMWTLDRVSGAITTWVVEWDKLTPDGTLHQCTIDGFDASAIVFAGIAPELLAASGPCPGEHTNGSPQAMRLWPVGSSRAGPPFPAAAIDPLAPIALSRDRRTAVTFQERKLRVWDVTAHTQRGSVTIPPTGNGSYDVWSGFALGGNDAVALIVLWDDATKARDRYVLLGWDIRTGAPLGRSAARVGTEGSRLLVRGDGTRAYVTTPNGLDVWVLGTAAKP
jgi:WD40 repeat protein